MKEPQLGHTDNEPAPDFLTHLAHAFGWNEEQAIEALGAYILGSEAGRAMQRALAPSEAGNRLDNAA